MNIFEKLVAVRKEVPYLQKENPGAQYKYVSSSQVLSNCKKKMDELGLLLMPCVTGHKVTESIIETKDSSGNVTKRTTTYLTEIDMTMTWVNAELPSEMITCTWYGQGVDIAGEKGVGKAMTYAEKYFMLKFFNIPTDKDDPDSFQDKLDKEDKEEKAPKQQAKTTTAGVISEAQQKRLFAISNGKTQQAKEVMLEFGYTSSKDIKPRDYEAICNKIEQLNKEAS